jgi:hypothetical protein
MMAGGSELTRVPPPTCPRRRHGSCCARCGVTTAPPPARASVRASPEIYGLFCLPGTIAGGSGAPALPSSPVLCVVCCAPRSHPLRLAHVLSCAWLGCQASACARTASWRRTSLHWPPRTAPANPTRSVSSSVRPFQPLHSCVVGVVSNYGCGRRYWDGNNVEP